MKNRTIFLAEDETIIAIDLKTTLKRNGFKDVVMFSDGEELLKKALSEPPGLIISDILLKNKTSGTKSAERIWKKHNVPIIFISGIDMKRYKKKYDPARCEFLKKPFKEGELLNAISKLIKNSE
jgi:DNA-binding NtrC family response regulator